MRVLNGMGIAFACVVMLLCFLNMARLPVDVPLVTWLFNIGIILAALIYIFEWCVSYDPLPPQPQPQYSKPRIQSVGDSPEYKAAIARAAAEDVDDHDDLENHTPYSKVTPASMEQANDIAESIPYESHNGDKS